MFELIFYVVVPLLVLIVGAITGTIQERRHLASLDEREPAVADIAVTDPATFTALVEQARAAL